MSHVKWVNFCTKHRVLGQYLASTQPRVRKAVAHVAPRAAEKNKDVPTGSTRARRAVHRATAGPLASLCMHAHTRYRLGCKHGRAHRVGLFLNQPCEVCQFFCTPASTIYAVGPRRSRAHLCRNGPAAHAGVRPHPPARARAKSSDTRHSVVYIQRPRRT